MKPSRNPENADSLSVTSNVDTIHLLPSSCLHVFRAVSFSQSDTLCLCEWVKEREPAPKTAGRGGGGGWTGQLVNFCFTV